MSTKEPALPVTHDNTEGSSATLPTISIVTATYNAAAVLPALIRSLEAQTDIGFEWVVADGASTDGTLQLLEGAKKKLNVNIESRPDSGIYDALNHAIERATGDYYVVMGADDQMRPEGISLYKRYCRETRADLVTAQVSVGGNIRVPRKHGRTWLSGMYTYISGHAVGVAIRRTLHDRFGLYSHRLSLVADQLFIVTAVRGGAHVHKAPFIAGDYSPNGASNTDGERRALEKFHMQRMLGSNFFVQLVLLNWRLLKAILSQARKGNGGG